LTKAAPHSEEARGGFLFVQIMCALRVSGRMVDRYGRVVEVLTLGHGPQQWIRVSWRGFQLGPGMMFREIGQGYHRTVRLP
jgi:hypothetical protein